jgi:5-methylcytosine-specific restriction enzyme A
MPRKSAGERGYGAKWRKARAEFLAANPQCALCAEAGRRTRATVVDHIQPHKNDDRLFWNRRNWQPLCESCHNGVKQSADRTGVLRGGNADGFPLDAGHHWVA